MRVTPNRPIAGPAGAQPAAAAAPAAAAPAASAPRSIEDTQDVLGIPTAEFTPRVRDAIMKLMAEVERLRQELNHHRRRLADLEAVADNDVLTPCLNRRAFVREMSRLISFAERYGLPASLVFIDLDGFKEINDKHGHAAGDAALIHVCETLKTHIRESDILGRIGGDEFGVLLAKANQVEAEKKCEWLAELIKASPLVWEGKAQTLGLTTGAYEFRAGESPAEAMARADRAMYERKKRARLSAKE